MTVVVLLPTRGRPQRAWEAVSAIRQTASLVDTRVLMIVDREDERIADYRALHWDDGYRAEVWRAYLEPEDTGNLVRATNTAVDFVLDDEPDAIIGHFGDDHLAQTPGWDKRVTETLREPGIAYGDDQLQGEHLPTAPFISGVIVRALGWYALPSCRHLFIDDAWKALGLGLERLHYLPDVIISHEHPATGRVEWDDGYRRANDEETTDHDRAAFHEWRNTTYYDDLTNVRRAIARW